MRSAISGTNLALSSSTDFFGRPVNSTLGVKDGANDLGSVAVDYTVKAAPATNQQNLSTAILKFPSRIKDDSHDQTAFHYV